jgi:hypothetical protein
MVTINYRGRISNNFIQFLVGAFLSHRYNLHLGAKFPIECENIKYKKSDNNIIGHNLIKVTDNNWLDIVENNEHYIKPHFHLDGFFNNKFFFEKYENELKSFFDIKFDTTNPEEVMVNYRIGELDGSRRVLPVEFYEDALENCRFTKGYITSDSLKHNFCKKLIDKFDLEPIILNPSETINFAKNFNKLILSEGGFSWVIGFLSQADEIICSGRHSNGREPIWHGDIYFDRWKKLYWDYDPTVIYDRIKLKKYLPIKLTENDFMCYNSDGTVYLEKK